jgi:AAA+ ATPase superfamily predicted ATPase
MVPLPFLDRTRELARLGSALDNDGTTLVVLFGRRRLGKSRLVRRLIEGRQSVYYVGDDRDAVLQRASLAGEIDRIIPGFASVTYPGWAELFDRFWREAPPSTVLALDELPSLVASSPELPSLLQKQIDQPPRLRRGLILCGSSQQMMHGLVLDASAPLYGRAREIVKIEPLAPHWLKEATKSRSSADVIERYAIWGGVPRYWELSSEYRNLWDAVEELVLDPLGVLHREPERLLRDDMTDVVRAASILSVIGQGANRASEIAARLALPATSLSRPLARLVDLGLIDRETPFGAALRDNKRSLYRVADPLLSFIYRFVEPKRSWLASGGVAQAKEEIRRQWPAHLGHAWERIARQATPRVKTLGESWGPAERWWGKDASGASLEIDLVATCARDPSTVLVGEAKLSARAGEVDGLIDRLAKKAAACPALHRKRVVPCLWVLRSTGQPRQKTVLGPDDVLGWR